MYNIKILNKKNEQKSTIDHLSCANTFIKRLLGLMGKNNYNGLIFKQKYPNTLVGSIHTCFMNAPLDIIYINKDMVIQEIITLKSWKLYIPKKGNIKYIIELPEKSIKKYNINIYDKIVIYHEKKKN